MRVCLIAPIPPFRGGIAKYCYSLAKELERRHDLLLISYRRQYPAILYGRKSQVDPEVDRTQVASEFRQLCYGLDSANPISWIATRRRIVAHRPDLVILPWWVSYWGPLYLYLLSSLRKRGIKVVLLCINVYEHEDSWPKKLLTEAVLRAADSMVVHSEPELRELLQVNPTATVREHLLPLFRYPAQPAPRGDGALQLLFFGFVRDYKGLDVLLKALALLRDCDLRLTVAGEFWTDKGQYLDLIERLGIGDRVTLVDQYLPDAEMGRFFSAADLVVLPYKYSKTSGIVATAYGFGKPVLATKVGGFHEIVREGETGRLVPPDDPQAFADGIRWFLGHRGVDFAANIESFAEECMSWRSLVDLIESFAHPGR